MHNSETEEGSEEEEDEEEEDICEEEEEEEEDESEEEEVNGGGGSDRVDLGVQTSLLESPSPTVPSPSTHTQVSNYTIPNRGFQHISYSEIPRAKLRKFSHKWSSVFLDAHLPHVLLSPSQNELKQFTRRGARNSPLAPHSIQ